MIIKFELIQALIEYKNTTKYFSFYYLFLFIEITNCIFAHCVPINRFIITFSACVF